MRSRIVAAAAVLLSAAIACGDAPPAEAGGTDATSKDLLTAAGVIEAPTGSLPPGSPRITPRTQPQAQPQAPPPQGQAVDLAMLGVDRGTEGAPLRVVEFSDYGCGYCRKFHQETWPGLVKDWVGSGKVEWKFLHFVTGMFKNSPAASMGAECALEQGQDVFERMNTRLWDGQSEWKGAEDPAPVVRGMAEAAGADMARFDTCFAEGRGAWRIQAATALANQVGIRGTPTFFVVGFQPVQGALPPEVFDQVLTAAYEKATTSGGDR